MKDKEIYLETLEELITMIPEKIPDYSLFIYNPSKKVISEYYKNFVESESNRNLSDVLNFPFKTIEEFFIFTFCIISKKYIKNPARTNKCLHIECMEAKSLFKFILDKGKCPLCDEINIEKNSKLGVDSIYIDKNFKKIYEIHLNNEMGFRYDMIIFNKFNTEWRPFLDNSTHVETEIMINANKEKGLNIQNFNEKDRNYLEILEMNQYIGEEDELKSVLNKVVNK